MTHKTSRALASAGALLCLAAATGAAQSISDHIATLTSSSPFGGVNAPGSAGPGFGPGRRGHDEDGHLPRPRTSAQGRSPRRTPAACSWVDPPGRSATRSRPAARRRRKRMHSRTRSACSAVLRVWRRSRRRFRRSTRSFVRRRRRSSTIRRRRWRRSGRRCWRFARAYKAEGRGQRGEARTTGRREDDGEPRGRRGNGDSNQ